MLIKTPLLHQRFGPHVFLSLSFFLSLSGYFFGAQRPSEFTFLPGLLRPSQWGEGRAPSRKGLRSPGRKVNSESLCAPGDQPEKERGRARARERERHGTRALMEQRCLNQRGVGIYTVLQDSYFQQR